ncbi:hypothetical protein ACP70R_005182 [Stipagrostis hirtigluma subsp. patula]
MGEAAERTGTSATADDTPAHVPDDIVAEILVPLPARSVILCGAVCKAWRRITTDPHFRARRRLPASILVYTHQPAAALPGSDLPVAGGNGAINVAVDALPVSSDEAGRRRLIRYPRLSHADPAHCHLLASCNGVLLFKQGQGSYLLCNPVTRQWAELPRLPNEYCNGRNGEYAFYFHRPSGEFRLLCCLNGLISTWGLVTPGASHSSRPSPSSAPALSARRGGASPPTRTSVYTHLHAAPSPASDLLARGYDPQDVALDALPVSSGGEADRRRLIRYPRVPSPGHCWLRGSCEGVLLFEADGGLFLLCNPVTRQWDQLPRLPYQYHKHLYRREYAFYFLQSSGSFQLLCRQDLYTWYIVSTGAAKPRRRRIKDTDVVRIIEFIPFTSEIVPPVALHGNLHWLPSKGPRDNETRMVAFDMVSESFHLMVGPPREARTPPMMKLFEMDGLLVAAAFTEGKYHVDLWFLEDYNARRWELRHRVTSPWKNIESLLINVWELMSVAAYDDKENVILGDHNELIVYNVRTRATVRTVRARTTVRTVKSVLWRSPLYICVAACV